VSATSAAARPMSPPLDAPPGPCGLDSPARFLYKVSVRGNGITVEG